MMGDVTRSHTYTFNLYGVPSLDEIIAECEKARQVMGGNAKCRFKTRDEQRDGHTLNATVTS